MSAAAIDELEVVSSEFEGCGHLLIGQRPTAVRIVEISASILKIDSDRLSLGFADQCRVGVAASNVGEASDVGEDL